MSSAKTPFQSPLRRTQFSLKKAVESAAVQECQNMGVDIPDEGALFAWFIHRHCNAVRSAKRTPEQEEKVIFFASHFRPKKKDVVLALERISGTKGVEPQMVQYMYAELIVRALSAVYEFNTPLEWANDRESTTGDRE